MKKLFIFIIPIILPLFLYAQDNGEVNTLLGSVHRVSGFGAPLISFTELDGEFAIMRGGGGALILNNRVFIGGYGLHLTNNVDCMPDMLQGYEIDMDHAGFWMGYVFFPSSIVHPSLSIFTGWGDAKLRKAGYETLKSHIYVITPVLEAELNVARFFKIGVGAQYRFVAGLDLPGYGEFDFSSPGVFVSFKFGWF